MSTIEEFTAELARLVARCDATAQALLMALLDEAEAQRGRIIKEQLETGRWPPKHPVSGP